MITQTSISKEQLLNWDVRAINCPEIFEQWLNAVVEKKVVSTTLIYTKIDRQNNLILSVCLADTQEELEESDPAFWFSYNALENEFWGFVSAAAKSKVAFDTEFFFDQLAGYC